MTIKEEFLALLKDTQGYPFDEDYDALLFDISIRDFPHVDILKQTQLKIEWWETNSSALNFSPRKQLYKWFRIEEEFKKRGGPKKVGQILKEVDDVDHRNWIKVLLGLEEN